jgi:hypothetical protein
MSLLIECACPRPDGAAVRKAALAVEDWQAVMRDTARHEMEPLLYDGLANACPDSVPPDVLARLRVCFHANGLRNTLLSHELLRIFELLRTSGMAAIAFKGPALAWSIYDDPALRPMADLDLLVRPADFSRALRILLADGYRPAYDTDARCFRGIREFPLNSPDSGVNVDLHWNAVPPYLAPMLPAPGLWDRAVPCRIAAGEVLTLSAADTLRHLCLHSAKHGWPALNRLTDLARLIDRVAVDWNQLLGDARAAGAQRVTLAGLLLAANVLRAPVPRPVLDAALSDPIVVRIEQDARRRLFAERKSDRITWDDAAFQLRLLERGSQKLRYCLGLLEPAPADLAAVPLPSFLYRAYYVVRPARLFVKPAVSVLQRIASRPRKIVAKPWIVPARRVAARPPLP